MDSTRNSPTLLLRLSFAATCCLLLATGLSANSQRPAPGDREAPVSDSRAGDRERLLRSGEEVEIAKARVEAKRAEIEAEEQTYKFYNSALSQISEGVKRDVVSPFLESQSKRDVLVSKARLALKKAELRELEIRLARAERSLQGGESASPIERDRSEIEARLDAQARRLDELEEEVRRLRRASEATRR